MVADTEPLESYLTNQVGNSFYHASEVIVMSTAIKMAMSGDDRAAFSELCRIVIEVSRHIPGLFGQLMGCILKTCMPDLETQIENHPDGPKLSTLSLPLIWSDDAKLALDDEMSRFPIKRATAVSPNRSVGPTTTNGAV